MGKVDINIIVVNLNPNILAITLDTEKLIWLKNRDFHAG